MKLRNLLRTPLSFNLSDGTPVHLEARGEMTGLPESLSGDPQVVRRAKRGLLRFWPESAKPEPAPEPKAAKPSHPPEERAEPRGRSQRTTTRKREDSET